VSECKLGTSIRGGYGPLGAVAPWYKKTGYEVAINVYITAQYNLLHVSANLSRPHEKILQNMNSFVIKTLLEGG